MQHVTNQFKISNNNTNIYENCIINWYNECRGIKYVIYLSINKIDFRPIQVDIH